MQVASGVAGRERVGAICGWRAWYAVGEHDIAGGTQGAGAQAGAVCRARAAQDAGNVYTINAIFFWQLVQYRSI